MTATNSPPREPIPCLLSRRDTGGFVTIFDERGRFQVLELDPEGWRGPEVCGFPIAGDLTSRCRLEKRHSGQCSRLPEPGPPQGRDCSS